MLVLSRNLGQEILIGDNIRVMITRISGDVVRIGIDAPQDVQILRPEAKLRERHEIRKGVRYVR